jgi:hypothetical protein
LQGEKTFITKSGRAHHILHEATSESLLPTSRSLIKVETGQTIIEAITPTMKKPVHPSQAR